MRVKKNGAVEKNKSEGMRVVEGLFPALAVVNLLWAGIAGPEEGRRYDDLISAMGGGRGSQRVTYIAVGALSVIAAVIAVHARHHILREVLYNFENCCSFFISFIFT